MSTSSPPPPSEESTPPPPPPKDSTPPSNGPPPPPPPPVDEGQASPDQKSEPPPSNNNDQSPQADNNNNNNNSQPSPKSNSGSSKNEDSYSPPLSKVSSGSESRSFLPSSSNLSHLSNDKALVAAVAAGAGILILIAILCLVSCARRRKRKRMARDNMHYYGGNNHGNKSNGYYNSCEWPNNGQQNNHQATKPPNGQVSSEYGSPVQPPPLPPTMNSSNMMTSGNFSGQGFFPPPPPPMMLGSNQSSFSYDDLAIATGGFAKTNLLGQGGFGYVHKGILPNGKEIAVKSLKANSGQGEREFQAEVDIISRVHHRHLVSLVGYCIAGSQRMLVYEFVVNDTLENHLHGKGKVQSVMNWSTRLKIALGSAKGFAYLHEDCHPRIIHRDIKASNILLDENFEAKVADFGLAKLSSDTETHVSTRIMGTFGYLAPEYASSGKLTEKSDVYSYGVVLLELITGKRPIDIDNDEDDSLVEWARPILERVIEGGGKYEDLADPFLEGRYDPQEMLHMIACASACIRHSARRRPKMSQVVRTLEGDASLDDLNRVMKTSQSSINSSDDS